MSHPPEPSTDDLTLPAIDFASPGRFRICNPEKPEPSEQSWQPAAQRIGEPGPVLHFNQPDELRAHLLALLQQARRQIQIYSQDFEPWLFHQRIVAQCCQQFLLAHRHNRLQVLLLESQTALNHSHLLLALSKRLPSQFEVRKAHPDYQMDSAHALLIDEQALLVRPHNDYCGIVQYCNAGRARQLGRAFDHAWQHASFDANLRSFLL